MRNHLRSNVIGYVALFFALTSSAMAANTVFSGDIVNGEVKTADLDTTAVTGPKIRADAVINNKLADDAVTSAEILDGSVTGADVLDGEIADADLADGSVGPNKVQDGAITSANVLDDSQADGGLGAQDLQTSAVGATEIATDAVAATEIQNDSIDAGEIVDFGLTNQDVGVLYAEVTSTGALSSSSGSVTASRVGAAGGGQYEVDFGRNVNLCTAVATLGSSGTTTFLGEVNVADRSANTEAVFVDTNNSDGTAADKAFRLVVVC